MVKLLGIGNGQKNKPKLEKPTPYFIFGGVFNTHDRNKPTDSLGCLL